MILHNIWIAWRSLKRSPILSLLIVSGVALGVAFATSFATIRHLFTKHPIPQKATTLFYVRLDSWDPAAPHPHRSGLPPQVTYRDMAALKRSTIPIRQTADYFARLTLYPDEKVGRPSREGVRMCFGDFFAMFDAPFRFGGAWDAKADAAAEPVVVLSQPMNERLFGGGNSVGKTVRLQDRDFRVVGVLERWEPRILFYDLSGNRIGDIEPLFIPFNLGLPMRIGSNGNSDGWGPSPNGGFEGVLTSEQTFIQYWVELKDAASVAAFRREIDNYIVEQKRLGRFRRPAFYKLSTVSELMDDFQVAPPQTTALFLVGLLFLAVCSVNLIGLLLGKFLARSNETGVRRALGASRKDVFLQHLVECEVVALAGGAVGIGLAALILKGVNAFTKSTMTTNLPFEVFRLDLPMLGLAIALSLASGLVAGAYPAWRACRLAPAISLKV